MSEHRFGALFIAVAGYILSPLSWWNDLLVNIPLALLLARPFSGWLYVPAFTLAYWLTNLLGFMLLHHGLRQMFSRTPVKLHWGKLTLASLFYTAIVAILVYFDWLNLPPMKGGTDG